MPHYLLTVSLITHSQIVDNTLHICRIQMIFQMRRMVP